MSNFGIDIDDVILNVFGAIIGYIIYIIIDKTGSKLPKFFRSNAFLNILVVLIIIAMIIYTVVCVLCAM